MGNYWIWTYWNGFINGLLIESRQPMRQPWRRQRRRRREGNPNEEECEKNWPCASNSTESTLPRLIDNPLDDAFMADIMQRRIYDVFVSISLECRPISIRGGHCLLSTLRFVFQFCPSVWRPNHRLFFFSFLLSIFLLLLLLFPIQFFPYSLSEEFEAGRRHSWRWLPLIVAQCCTLPRFITSSVVGHVGRSSRFQLSDSEELEQNLPWNWPVGRIESRQAERAQPRRPVPSGAFWIFI